MSVFLLSSKKLMVVLLLIIYDSSRNQHNLVCTFSPWICWVFLDSKQILIIYQNINKLIYKVDKKIFPNESILFKYQSLLNLLSIYKSYLIFCKIKPKISLAYLTTGKPAKYSCWRQCCFYSHT